MVNSLGRELKGMVILVTGDRFKDRSVVDRVFECNAGFGCQPSGHGRRIIGIFVASGDENTIDSQTEIEREAMAAELAAAKAVKQEKDGEVDEVEYDCGCLVSKGEDGTWHVSLFCDEHDPTVKHDGGGP